MTNLTTLANRFGTDKGTTVGNKHCYTGVYDRLFAPLRDKPINMLEIGLSIGGPEHVGKTADRVVTDVPSIRMWQEYFRKGMIYGLDISDCKAFENERFKTFRVDCGEREALRAVAQTGIEFDIIIDDGSHASYHQQLALEELFPTLKPGGIYIIEDLDWQPKHYEASLPPRQKTSALLASGSALPITGIADIRLYSRQDIVDQLPLREKFQGQPLVRGLRRALGFKLSRNYVKLAVIRKDMRSHAATEKTNIQHPTG